MACYYSYDKNKDLVVDLGLLVEEIKGEIAENSYQIDTEEIDRTVTLMTAEERYSMLIDWIKEDVLKNEKARLAANKTGHETTSSN